MAKNDSNHEFTRISIREEVARALEGVVPASKQSQVVARLEQLIEHRSGPLPDLGHISGLDQLVPGCAKEILGAALQEMQHRREVEKRELEQHDTELALLDKISTAEFRGVREGRLIGASVYLACFGVGIFFLEKGAPQLAMAAIGTAALGVIVQLIRGGWSPAVRLAEGVTDRSKSDKNKS